MRRTNAYSLFLPSFLLAFSTLHAQAPAAGTTVSVKMIDTVSSGSDPAGKQYRASVTTAVTDSSGVTIAQGAAATVTLASSGANYTAQLSSIIINGQSVAVTSNSASVTSVAQSAQAKASSAVNSVLGGFGHHINTPSSVAAVATATGQLVSLPTGTTLTFVLGQPPASSPAISVAQLAAAQPAMAAAAPAPSVAANPAPGPAAAATGQYVYCYTGQYANPPTNFHTSATEPTTYFSEVFPEPSKGLQVNVDWTAYLQKKSLPEGYCLDGALSTMQGWKQQREAQFKKEGKKVVETGWKFDPADDSVSGQAAAAATAAATPTAAANQNYVWCNSAWGGTAGTMMPAGTVMYFSDVFPADMPPPVVHLPGHPPPPPNANGAQINRINALQTSFFAFLQKKYGYKDSGNYPVDCRAGYPPTLAGLQDAKKYKQQFEDDAKKNRGQVVETGWMPNSAGDSVSGQASAAAPAAAPASTTAPAPTTANTAYYKECAALFGNRANENCAAAANEYYVYCSGSASDDGPVYFSDVFAFNKDVSSGGLSADLAPSFLQFLETKYGLKVSNDFYPTSHYTGGAYPTTCSRSFTPLAWAQQQKQTGEDNLTKSHKQFVETGWKSSIAPLPPVTAPQAAANEHYVFCYSDKALPVQYFSEIFAAVPAGDSTSNAFLVFLQKKYAFNDTRPGPHVDCEVSPKPANAYMFQTEWSVRQNMEGLGDANRKPIETGWKFTP